MPCAGQCAVSSPQYSKSFFLFWTVNWVSIYLHKANCWFSHPSCNFDQFQSDCYASLILKTWDIIRHKKWPTAAVSTARVPLDCSWNSDFWQRICRKSASETRLTSVKSHGFSLQPFSDGSFVFSASKEVFHLIDVYILKHVFSLRPVCLQNVPGWIEVKMFARLLLLLLVLPSDARRGWAATSTSLLHVPVETFQTFWMSRCTCRPFWSHDPFGDWGPALCPVFSFSYAPCFFIFMSSLKSLCVDCIWYPFFTLTLLLQALNILKIMEAFFVPPVCPVFFVSMRGVDLVDRFRTVWVAKNARPFGRKMGIFGMMKTQNLTGSILTKRCRAKGSFATWLVSPDHRFWNIVWVWSAPSHTRPARW